MKVIWEDSKGMHWWQAWLLKWVKSMQGFGHRGTDQTKWKLWVKKKVCERFVMFTMR